MQVFQSTHPGCWSSLGKSLYFLAYLPLPSPPALPRVKLKAQVMSITRAEADLSQGAFFEDFSVRSDVRDRRDSLIRVAAEYLSPRGCACAWVCVGVRGCAWVCVVVRGGAWWCVVVRRGVWGCVGVHGTACKRKEAR